MTFSDRRVISKEFPKRCDSATIRSFLSDLTRDMTQSVRPAVVLDFSNACKIDRQALQLLLSCLEEAMKRNGDVRLSGLHRDAWAVLKSAGIDRLFQNFPTADEAVDSYRRPQFERTAFGDGSAADEPAANAA